MMANVSTNYRPLVLTATNKNPAAKTRMKLWPWGKWGGGNKKRTHPAAVCDLTRGSLFPAGHTSRRGNGGQAEWGNIRQYLVKHLILQLQFISKVCSIATSWYSISYQMQTLQTLGTSVSRKLRFLAKTQPTSQPGSDLYIRTAHYWWGDLAVDVAPCNQFLISHRMR